MSTSTERYYVRRRGRVLGPFDIRQLQRLERRGQIDLLDDFSTDRRNWNKLSELSELAPEETPAEPLELAGDEGSEDGELAPEQAVPADETEWYYHHQGQQTGPVNVADLHALIAQGVLLQNDSIWCDGMADWQPVYQVFPDLAPPGGIAQPGTMLPPGGVAVPMAAQPNISVNLGQQFPSAVDRTESTASQTMINSGYICAALSLLPFLGAIFGLIGMILGIVTVSRNAVGHGLAQILIVVFMSPFGFWFSYLIVRELRAAGYAIDLLG